MPDQLSVFSAVDATANGIGIGLGFFFIRWAVIFMAGRWDKKEAQLNEGTKLLIDQLSEQNTALFERLVIVERGLAECKEEHAQCRAEVMELKGFLHGRGNARQEAQLIIAAEKKKAKDDQ